MKSQQHPAAEVQRDVDLARHRIDLRRGSCARRTAKGRQPPLPPVQRKIVAGTRIREAASAGTPSIAPIQAARPSGGVGSLRVASQASSTTTPVPATAATAARQMPKRVSTHWKAGDARIRTAMNGRQG
jgi:hypothetical protein